MTVLMFAASLAAVLALAGAAWWLKLGGPDTALADEAAACAAAQDGLPGFVATRALLSVDRRAALVGGEGGRIAVLKAHGARAAAREVAWTAVRATDSGIVVETGERRFGRVWLTGIDALDARRLAAPARSSIVQDAPAG